MSALVRLSLVAAVLLFSGGVAVAPHEDPAKPPLHVDHVASALRLAVLTQVGGPADAALEPAFVEEHAVTSLGPALAVALIALAFPRPWRPGRGAVAVPAVALVGAQALLAPADRPPRSASPR